MQSDMKMDSYRVLNLLQSAMRDQMAHQPGQMVEEIIGEVDKTAPSQRYQISTLHGHDV